MYIFVISSPIKINTAMSTITAAALQQEVKKALKAAFGTTSLSKAKAALKGQADEWGTAKVVAAGFIFLYSANPNMYASCRVKWMNNEMALDQASYTKAGKGRLVGAGQKLTSIF